MHLHVFLVAQRIFLNRENVSNEVITGTLLCNIADITQNNNLSEGQRLNLSMNVQMTNFVYRTIGDKNS